MTHDQLLSLQKQHLAGLLEAIQRCVYFLNASDSTIPWPLTGQFLSARKKDNDLFEALAAVNERFAKLQDTMGVAMRHSLILSGEQADSFIKVLSIFEKNGVISSVDDCQIARTARNLAAHDYETDCDEVAEHFNTLHTIKPSLFKQQPGLCSMPTVSWLFILPARTLPASLRSSPLRFPHPHENHHSRNRLRRPLQRHAAGPTQ